MAYSYPDPREGSCKAKSEKRNCYIREAPALAAISLFRSLFFLNTRSTLFELNPTFSLQSPASILHFYRLKMLLTKVALCLSSLVFLASAQEADDATLKGLDVGRTRASTSNNRLMTRSLDKRCTGSCSECFGAGYTLCPGSSIFCYLPGDDYYGLDSCSSGSSGSGSGSATGTATASASTSTSTSDGTDICSQVGATCVSCFGSGYMECSDGYHCYNPNDPDYATCPDDGTGSSSGGSGNTTDSSCAAKWGAGNIACGSTGCYNPDDGEVCCEDGCKSNILGWCEIAKARR